MTIFFFHFRHARLLADTVQLTPNGLIIAFNKEKKIQKLLRNRTDKCKKPHTVSIRFEIFMTKPNAIDLISLAAFLAIALFPLGKKTTQNDTDFVYHLYTILVSNKIMIKYEF